MAILPVLCYKKALEGKPAAEKLVNESGNQAQSDETLAVPEQSP